MQHRDLAKALKRHFALALAVAMGLAALHVVLYFSCPTCEDVVGPPPLDDFSCLAILLGIVVGNRIVFAVFRDLLGRRWSMPLAWPFAIACGVIGYVLAQRHGFHFPLFRKSTHVWPALEGCFLFFTVLWFDLIACRPKADEVRG